MSESVPHTVSVDDGRDPRPARPGMTAGTVTFLDVLGWKGIWLRRNLDVVDLLKKLVDRARETVRGKPGDTRVLGISDTIVILTTGSPADGIALHGDVAASLVCESIDSNIPIRGATACGEFFVDASSVMVGPAIDEAASWHEC